MTILGSFWALVLLLQLLNVLAGIHQMRHPFANRKWRLAWGLYAALHAALDGRWAWHVWQVLHGYDAWTDVTIPLVISVGFFVFSRLVIRVFQIPEVVVDPVPPATIVLNHDLKIMRWDMQAEYLLGWSAGQTLGKDFVDLIIPPWHREAHRAELHTWMTEQHGAGPYLLRSMPTPALHQDGHVETLHILTTPVLQTDGSLWFHKALRKMVAL